MQNGIGYLQFFGNKTYSNPYNDRTFKGRVREIEKKEDIPKKSISMDSICATLGIKSPEKITDEMIVQERDRWRPRFDTAY